MPLNFILQLSLTFYPTDGGTSFNNLFCNTEFLVISLTFRVYKTTDEKDIFCRLIGVFLAVITKIHKNQESLALILSTSLSSIFVISSILLNLFIDFLESRGVSYAQEPQVLSQLEEDVLVWSTEEISTFNPKTPRKGAQNDSKESRSQHKSSK